MTQLSFPSRVHIPSLEDILDFHFTLYVISKIQNVVLSVDHISQKILNSVHTRQKLIFLGLVSRYFLQTLNFIERCKQLRIDFAPLTFYFCIQH